VADEQEHAPPPSNDEELLRQVQEELKKLKVSDVLIQTVYTVSSLGYRRLSDEDRDLDQARLAIEALRALVPVLGGAVPSELKRDLEQTVANMQLAYASAVSAQPPEPPAEESADAG
jgi:hypothetical protein